MFTRILVPLDGSFLAGMAVELVRRIADSKCEIILLTSVQIPEYLVSAASPLVSIAPVSPTLESARADASRYLEEVAKSLRQSGFHVQFSVEAGDPAECIIQTADKLGADLIAMATHGRSGVDRWLYGSVTSRVLDAATCPVLVIPGRNVQREHEGEVTEPGFS